MRTLARTILGMLLLGSVAAWLVGVTPASNVPLHPSQIVCDRGARTEAMALAARIEYREEHATPVASQPLVAGEFAISQLFPPRRIRRIRVVKYSSACFNSPERVRQTIAGIWQSKAESPSRGIAWAEGNLWSLDLKIELADRRSARIITDGFHVCAEVADGSFWFFRIRQH